MRTSLIFKALIGAALTVVGVLSATPAYAVEQCTPTRDPQAAGLNTCNISWLSDGLAYYALLAALVGILISAALWAMGNKGQNPGTELTGKKGIILCLTAAFFIGALPAMINHLEGTAKKLDTNGITNASVRTADSGGGAGKSGPGDKWDDYKAQPLLPYCSGSFTDKVGVNCRDFSAGIYPYCDASNSVVGNNCINRTSGAVMKQGPKRSGDDRRDLNQAAPRYSDDRRRSNTTLPRSGDSNRQPASGGGSNYVDRQERNVKPRPTTTTTASPFLGWQGGGGFGGGGGLPVFAGK